MTAHTSPAPPSTSTAASTWTNRPLLAAIVVLIVLVVGTLGGADILFPWHPFGTYGFSATATGTITSVIPDSAASRAGIHVGDRVAVETLDARTRRRVSFLSMSTPGDHITLPIVRGGARREVTLVSSILSRTLADNVTDIIDVGGRLAGLIIAAALLLMRPSLVTWSFFALTIGSVFGAAVQFWASDDAIGPLEMLLDACMIAGAWGYVTFAMLLPRTQASRSERLTAWILGIFCAAWFALDAAYGYSVGFQWAARGSEQWTGTLDRINVSLYLAIYAATVLAFVINYARAQPEERLRLQWVVCGFAIGSFGWFGTNLSQTFFGYSPSLALNNLILALNIFIPISVAYAILRHRVFNVRFIISRALVYGTLTTAAVALLALLDFAVARQIEETRLGLAVEIAGAVVIGLGMNRLHGWVDAAVDRYVFRALHQAEQRLAVAAKSVHFAQTPEAIDALVAREASDALALSFVRVERELNFDDALVLELQAQRSPVARGDALVLPMFVRHQFIGYVACGAHSNGAAIDPAERTILEHLTGAAAIAYDHTDREARAAEVAHLRSENAVLRSLVAPNAANASPNVSP